MTRVLPRTHSHSSTLLRTLADLAVVENAESGNVFAERLALWVDFADAIKLSAVHNSKGAGLPRSPGRAGMDADRAIGEEFARARMALERAVSSSCKPNVSLTRLQLPVPPPDATPGEAASYATYRWFHLAHQRDMELSIRQLRTKMRERIAKASPALRQLVELDAALDGILVEREKKLLSLVPSLLEKRYQQLHQLHQQSVANSGQKDNPTLWLKPGGWLGRFSQELQTVLLAELDLRLQPIVGLIEAHHHQTSTCA